MGYTGVRFDGLDVERLVSLVLLVLLRPLSSGPRCPVKPLEFSPSVCVSSNSPDSLSVAEDLMQRSPGNSNPSILAKKTMVYFTMKGDCGRSNSLTVLFESAKRVQAGTCMHQEIKSDGLEIERGWLKELCISDDVNDTLLQSREQIALMIAFAEYFVNLL